MKAEERHQLQENDLATWMRYGLPMWLQKNGSYLLLIAALCFLGYQLYGMHQRKQENARITAYEELRSAPQSENPVGKLQSLIDTTDIPTLKAQACLAIAQQYQDAILFPEKYKALNLDRPELLTRAAKAYDQAAAIYGNDVLGSGKALLGKAAVLEDQEKWDDAAKIYESMSDPKGTFANTPFTALAADRLKSLPDRRNTPRLATMMPPPPATAPAGQLPGLPGSFGAPITGPELPGAIGGPAPSNLTLPVEPILPTAPATQPK